jgi:hypothetical protein
MNKNLYTNGFLFIFKIYFHNIRGTPFENHCFGGWTFVYTVMNVRILYKVGNFLTSKDYYGPWSVFFYWKQICY